MNEPVHAQQIMLATMAGAMVVMFGAIYAFLFAWSRLRQRAGLMPVAYLAYACLAGAVFALATALHLTGFWSVVAAAMLLGYLLAPHAIWHLCEGTHQGHEHSVECVEAGPVDGGSLDGGPINE